MTRAPRFSGKVYVEADAASALARGQAKGWAYRYNLTAEGLQAEMGKPESERSEAGKDLTDTLRSRWDDFKDLLQYRNGVISVNDGKKNRLSRSQRRDANLVRRRRGLSA
jgi:hypothetical protein